jgi:phosphopantothenate--cysteine ligase
MYYKTKNEHFHHSVDEIYESGQVFHMNILITAGGTTEKIDEVRKITNSATGKLGSLIAGEFLKQAQINIETIYYVCEQGTIIPNHPLIKIVYTQGILNLEETLEDILSTQKIDMIIHSMAVSDYMVKSLTTAEKLSMGIALLIDEHLEKNLKNDEELSEKILNYIRNNGDAIDNRNKLSSGYENLILTMKQTPKIIGMFKTIQPKAILVGFKLLNGVSEQALVDTAYALLTANNCDFVLANDAKYFKDSQHIGLLVSPGKVFKRLEGKESIAVEIVKAVLKRRMKQELF